MPDISLCKNEKCKDKEACRRYLATPSDYMQSYIIKDCEEKCELYWEVKENK